MDYHPIQVVAEILLVTSCYRNWNKCWPNGRLAHMQTLLPPLSCHLPLFQNVCMCLMFHMKKNDFCVNEYTGDIFSYQ